MVHSPVSVTKTGDQKYSWSASQIEMSDGETLALKIGAGFAAGASIDAVIFYGTADKKGPVLGKWTRKNGNDASLSGIVSVAADADDESTVTLTDLWSNTKEDDDIWFTMAIGPDTPDPELVLKKKAGGGLAAGA